MYMYLQVHTVVIKPEIPTAVNRPSIEIISFFKVMF